MIDKQETDKVIVGLAAIALLPAHLLLEGWVALKLWTWFAVPLGAPTMHLGHALGLMVLVGLVKVRPSVKPCKEPTAVETAASMLASGFVAPLIALGLGWIAKAVFL